MWAFLTNSLVECGVFAEAYCYVAGVGHTSSLVRRMTWYLPEHWGAGHVACTVKQCVYMRRRNLHLPTTHVGLLVCDLFCTVWSEVDTASDTFPWLSAPVAQDAPYRLRAFGLRGGAWDKALFRPAGFCSKLSELHWTSSIIFGSRFSVWGWSTSPDVARAMVTKEILSRARDSGVLADAIRAKRLRKLFRTDESVHTWLDDFLSSRHPPDPDCVTPDGPCDHKAKPPPFVRVLPQAPCVFELMKWKSNETVADGLKWRDIVSFKNHPLQQWSKVISRCLQALVNFLCDLGCGLGFAKMQGVRDQVHAAQRMGAVPELTIFAEEDMADMFWEERGRWWDESGQATPTGWLGPKNDKVSSSRGGTCHCEVA